MYATDPDKREMKNKIDFWIFIMLNKHPLSPISDMNKGNHLKSSCFLCNMVTLKKLMLIEWISLIQLVLILHKDLHSLEHENIEVVELHFLFNILAQIALCNIQITNDVN